MDSNPVLSSDVGIDAMQQNLRTDARLIPGFIGIIWLVFLIDMVLPANLVVFGVIPRTITGLFGVVTMPFLHDGWGHIFGNTVPLCVLLFQAVPFY
jgi:membrane associated rhomboid family serine protease